MDFEQAHARATGLLSQLETTPPQSLQYHPLETEFVGVVSDLAGLPHLTLDQRSEIEALRTQLAQVRARGGADALPGKYGENPFVTSRPEGPAAINDASPHDSPLDPAGYHQQLLQEQDTLISTQLTQSINNLHRQALHINEELDDQRSLLDQMEDSMDRLNLKIVGSGMRRINKFLETSEWGGNCCILLLIVVLAVLLVLLIIA